MTDTSTPAGTRLATRLAAAGLDARTAPDELAALGVVDDPVRLARVLEVVGGVAAPDDALRALVGIATRDREQLAVLIDDDDWFERVAAVAGTSRPLGDLFALHGDAVESLRDVWSVTATDVADRVQRALRDLPDDASDQDLATAVARIRRRVTADVAGRDLTGLVTVDQVGAELSNLAEGVLDGTLRALRARAGVDVRLSIIGMGKLGGRELNYVSDVDVMFVHGPARDDDALAPEEVAAAARGIAEQLLAVLNASTTMGRAYEVDPTLRPEGRSGALTREVDGFVAYWRRWARTWEFQALLKARVVGGDRQLGDELLDAAEEFLWPEELEPGVVAEIRAMKKRVEGKREVLRHGAREVKLGPGGLRDIEFSVQLLQLVHGRSDRRLRRTGTLAALTALAEGGYVAPRDARDFATAYRLLRTVEHRLQLAHERRTHVIPADEDRQAWLARAMGYRSEGASTALELFRRDLTDAQARVRDLHAKLFYRPLLEVHAAVPRSSGDLVRLDESAAVARLSAMGFRDPAGTQRHVAAMTAGVGRVARTLRAVLPTLLHELVTTPDPDGGVLGLRRLVEAHGRGPTLLPLLRDHPPAVERLARLVGLSGRVVDMLVAQPLGLRLLRDDADLSAVPRDELVLRAAARLNWQAPAAVLRRFTQVERLRTIVRDRASAVAPERVGDELTALGEAVIEVALDAARRQVATERGGDVESIGVDVAVIGLGKFGGRELNYCSDLDVVFVHAPRDGTPSNVAAEIATRVVERVMALLARITPDRTAFEVDVDLRPEGRSGPLTRSLESYATYFDRWADPWEHQAMLRARPVAGDGALGRRFEDVVDPYRHPQHLAPHVVERVRELKGRIERERMPRGVRPEHHLKLGPGGLSDVEWLVQLLQLRHAAAHPALRTPSTQRALDGLQEVGLLTIHEADALREGYTLLVRVRNALHLLGMREVDVLPDDDVVRRRVALVLGMGDGDPGALRDELARVREAVADAFSAHFRRDGP